MDIVFALFILICSVITIFLWTIYIRCFNKQEKEIIIFGWTLILMPILTLGATIFTISDVFITPIDVYRGKTTLEITYKDSIAIDSVVVWKEKVNEKD